ncbi:MAG: DUF488 family protein [Candidatus Melainabacteria bacterium]|nr:DUF488 family protein [Candidatus Melainabacteria bacterium]
MVQIDVQRVYDFNARSSSQCFLVDRLWPRGMKKEALKGVVWLPEVAPSTALRKWFSHDVEKWQEFMSQYFKELDDNSATWQPILEAGKAGAITLLYGAKDTKHNQAIALKAYLERLR